MANEIATATSSGKMLYALLRTSSASVWNTSTGAFEVYTAANYGHYAVALVEQGSTGFYAATFPSQITVAGRYVVDLRQQAGSAPLPSDAPLGGGSLRWNGSAEVDVLSNADKSAYQVDLGQTVPTSNTAQTVGDALNAARAQGFGKWVLSSGTLTLYAPDGTTVVRAFTLDDPLTPTSRS